jgi:biotin carboxyl carrier protein
LTPGAPAAAAAAAAVLLPQVGDRVKKGATLGYIEQLGTFVEVKVRRSDACSTASMYHQQLMFD